MKVVLSYLAGTLSGALMTVLAAWIVSGFLEPAPVAVRSAVLVLCAVLIWLIKEGPLGTVLTLPETRRQIPAQVFGGSLTRGAFHFGFELGTGVRTYVPSAAPYVLLVALVLVQPTLGTALLVAIGFGFGRALPLMVQFSLHDRQLLGSQLLRGSERLTSQAACLLTLIGALALV